MNKDHFVAVIIPTCNNKIEDINKTVNSILTQTYNSELLKIVVIDNGSTNGTYEHVLKIVSSHTERMSVFRINERTKTSRVFYKLSELLRFSGLSFTTVLNPGDTLYKDCIQYCTTVMRTQKFFEGKVLLFEMDQLNDLGELIQRDPIYSDSFIIRTHNKTEFLTTGVGHRVQAIYAGLPVDLGTHLMEIIETINFGDWFYKFFDRHGDFIYINQKLGSFMRHELNDPVNDLLNRFLVLKRRFYLSEMDEKSYAGEEIVDARKYSSAYKCLAELSLKYAIEALDKSDYLLAKDCLNIAQMVYLNIRADSMFETIEKVLSKELDKSMLDKHRGTHKSIKPPKDCFLI